MYYEENRFLEEEDMGHDTPIYHIIIHDKPFLIGIGKERKLIQKKNTYYFPVYLLNKTNVQSQIGAFQFESSKENPEDRVKPFLDKSGDLDLNRLGDIVLYSFANYDYFQDITISITPVGLSELEAKYIQEKASDLAENMEDDDEIIHDKKKPFELSSDEIKQSASLKKSTTVLKEGIFTIDKTTKRIAMLPQETKDDADKQKGEYTDRAKQTWIEKYMSNNHFEIVETDNNGDCFFDAVRLAFSQIGYETTINILRAIVAREATDEMFSNYRELFTNTISEIDDVEKELRRLLKENKNLKERLAAMPKTDKASRAEVILSANTIKDQHSTLKEKQVMNRSFLEEFQFMKGVDTMDKFREVIQTPSYWADDWAISVIERELNVKMCIFSEEDYDANDENNVIRCSLSGNSDSDSVFDPEYYIMVTYSSKHYRLVTYKNKRILKFSEIPYDVKTMIVIKCMEKNSGVFSQIQDFKNFKSRLGVEDEPDDVEDSAFSSLDLDDTVIFAFYNKSSGTAKPGKAANEKMPATKKREYTDLELKRNDDWRRKLDDDWSTLFTVDGKKWKTVEHYYQAAKFKKHNPHFYAKFSLSDSSKEFADDVEIAKAAGSEKGVLKKGKKEIPLRPPEVKIDSDFYGSRRSEEREKALYAKFSQSEDLKAALLATKKAVLKQYVPKQAATPDHLLMKVREKLVREN